MSRYYFVGQLKKEGYYHFFPHALHIMNYILHIARQLTNSSSIPDAPSIRYSNIEKNMNM